MEQGTESTADSQRPPKRFFRLRQFGWAFLTGMVCALLLGIAGQSSFNQSHAASAKASRFWTGTLG